MTIVVAVVLAIAWVHYGSINESEDPRVLEAKVMYKRYDILAEQKKYDSILILLNNMEHIYLNFEDYKDSYEVGVICNNRAATFITVALFETSDSTEKQFLLKRARNNVKRSIQIYKNWQHTFAAYDLLQIRAYVNPIYDQPNPLFKLDEIAAYKEKRTQEMIVAQRELPRRLSVSYTNLGMIQRHQGKTKEALESYKEAIDLWDKNYTAKNNVKVIMGLPVEKPNVLERLFPPEK
ncbi:MAG: hypothetical protein B7C24_00805 [Bacteroidetes bacterium 4572_77]|nr:MAG: hypothetical protein B7C24_00805 [Bacteroidetes bacterium 4572_77]